MLTSSFTKCLKWISKDFSSLIKVKNDVNEIVSQVEVLINEGMIIDILEKNPQFNKF
jgi:hypothetical protein